MRLYNTKTNRFMYFGHEGNSFPNDIYILPLCIDCDMDNPGGGSVDMHPIYNNVKLHIKWDASKIEALAWSGDPNYAQPTVSLNMPVFTSDTYSTVSTGAPSVANGLTNAAGSTQGAIVITSPSAGTFKYSIDAKITTTALVLDMITFDSGQLYKQGHS